MERVFISRLLLVVFLLHAAPSHTEEHVSPKPSVVQAERVRREAEKLRLSKDHDAALKLFEEVQVCMRVCSRVSVRASLFFRSVYLCDGFGLPFCWAIFARVLATQHNGQHDHQTPFI